MRVDVGEDHSGKSELLLEQLANDVAVFARAGIVHMGHGTHDGSHAGLDGVLEWPEVEFVNSLQLSVSLPEKKGLPCANLFIGIRRVHCGSRVRRASGSVRLLFVKQVVPSACNDSSSVHSTNGFGQSDTAEIGVRGEGFRLTTAPRSATQRPSLRTVDEVVAHEVKLTTRSIGLGVEVVFVPGHSQGVAHGESRDIVLVVDSSKAVLVGKRRPRGAVGRVYIAASDDGNLFSIGQTSDKGFGFRVSFSKLAELD